MSAANKAGAVWEPTSKLESRLVQTSTPATLTVNETKQPRLVIH